MYVVYVFCSLPNQFSYWLKNTKIEQKQLAMGNVPYDLCVMHPFFSVRTHP